MGTDTPKSQKPKAYLNKSQAVHDAARRYGLVLETIGAPIRAVEAGPNSQPGDVVLPDLRGSWNKRRAIGAIKVSRKHLDGHGGHAFNPLTANRELMSQVIMSAYGGAGGLNPIGAVLRGAQRAAMLDRTTAADGFAPALAAIRRQATARGDTTAATAALPNSVAAALVAEAVGLKTAKEVDELIVDRGKELADAGADAAAVKAFGTNARATRTELAAGSGNVHNLFRILDTEMVLVPKSDGGGDEDGDNGGGGGGQDTGAKGGGGGGGGAGTGEGAGDEEADEDEKPEDEDEPEEEPDDEDDEDDEEFDDFKNDLDALRHMMDALDRDEDYTVYRRVFGERRASKHHLSGWVDPDTEAVAIAGRLRRALDKARWPEPTVVARPVALPPGKLRTNAALQADARRAAGDPTPATDLFTRQNRRIDAPTDLSVGLAIDCSGSMDYLARACARWAYAFSQGAYRAGARFIASTWGGSAYPLTDAGQTMRHMPVLRCPDGTTALGESLQACMGGLDMTKPGRARILIAATDGELHETAMQEVLTVTLRAQRHGIRLVQIFSGGGRCIPLPGWELVAAHKSDTVVKALEDLLVRESRASVR